MKHWTALVLGLALLAVVNAAMPKFVDVSRAKGLLPLNQVSDWRLYANKYQGMTVADLDGDGYYELYCPNHGNNAELYWSNGARGFTYVDPRVYKQDTHGAVALDLNGDKHLDIIHTRGGQRGSSPTLPTVIETFGKGNMRQTQGQAFFIDLEPMRGRSIASFDFNGNGWMTFCL
ncbi:hypothetical protein NDN08_007095 [Rhodosorus marinus]|uniref:VCBS repeat-containing protein n=1 Tax=Rhodosorus marinus TaxID=101924 RepID=A0AAV8UII2_9RHOD|nr:hypothetical protein NDN08_007095 [Rhodosorus marinus]